MRDYTPLIHAGRRDALVNAERMPRRGPAVDPAAEAARAFRERFGVPARWLVVAPGRVNLIGEHTDYNDGFVLPMAIGRSVAMAASPADASRPRIRIHSSAMGAGVEIDLERIACETGAAWSNYVRGVVAGFQSKGATVGSMDVMVESDLPLGGGLSSSAALEVATATLLEAATGRVLDPIEKALLCQRAEHDYAGVPCGLMDQLASVLGDERGALLVDCRTQASRLVRMNGAAAVLVCDTGVRHALAEGEYARRRAECERAARALHVKSLRDATIDGLRDAEMDPVARRRARHVVSENARTLAAAKFLEEGDFDGAGRLFYESHASLRDDYEVSCAELDCLVDAARDLGAADGVFGSRMTGGGFGGSTVSLVRADSVDAVMGELGRRYAARTGRVLDAFVTRPARGARRLHLDAAGDFG
jgi:galactokinase